MDKNLFSNTEISYKRYSDTHIKLIYILFSVLKYPKLIKITSIIIVFLLKIHFPIRWLIKCTIYKHFCGGITLKETNKIIEDNYKYKVHSILDYAKEGEGSEKSFKQTLDFLLKTIDNSIGRESIPFVVFKPTGLGRLDIYEKVSLEYDLTKEEKEEWSRVLKRYDTIIETAIKSKVKIMIDAEETWIQKAVDDIALSYMQKYNKNGTAWVYTTLQFYRKDRLAYLHEIHQTAIENNFILGIKIVRGAYMEKETERALEKNYPNPIHDCKENTDSHYNQAIHLMLNNLAHFAMFLGSHNEESHILAIELMEKNNISKDNPRIWFSQLYSMGNNITYYLAKEGYNVANYLPFGPILEVMPYLFRRANENTSLNGQSSKELQSLRKELSRRKKHKKTLQEKK